MLDDVFEALLEIVGLKALPDSKRAQGCFRVFFGLLIFGLGLAGAWHTISYPASLHFRVAGIALMLSIAFFGLINVVLLRKWRWPGCLIVISFFGLFFVRIVFGP